MLESKIEERVINFAKKHENVKAVHRGTLPEDGSSKAYYFLTGMTQLDEKFEEDITNLDLELARGILRKKANITFLSWPCEPQNAEDYGFIKDCIYKR